MKHLFFLLLFGVALTGCGPRQPDTFDKSPTANGRVNIPGTRLFIAPPADFKVATNFIGLEHADNSSFQVMDLVGGNFYTNAGTFSREEFEARGDGGFWLNTGARQRFSMALAQRFNVPLRAIAADQARSVYGHLADMAASYRQAVLTGAAFNAPEFK